MSYIIKKYGNISVIFEKSEISDDGELWQLYDHQLITNVFACDR